MDKIRKPIEAEFQRDFQEQTDKINREYQRQKNRQEHVGKFLSRITPTASLTYFAMNLTQTGQLKRDEYFQTGERYYNQLNDAYFSKTSDDPFAQMLQIAHRFNPNFNPESEAPAIPTPPTLRDSSVSDTFASIRRRCLLTCFFRCRLYSPGISEVLPLRYLIINLKIRPLATETSLNLSDATDTSDSDVEFQNITRDCGLHTCR